MDTDTSFDKYDEPRLHMERLMKSRLVDFDLSLRILIPLESSGIRTLGDLVTRNRSDLAKIRMLGKKGIETIVTLLESYDLSLDMKKGRHF